MENSEIIKSKMRNLNNLIISISEKRDTYDLLLNEKLSVIKSLLNASIYQISEANNKLDGGAFMIESKRIDCGKLNEKKTELKKIKSTTIPNIEQEIKTTINNLNQELVQLRISYQSLKRQLLNIHNNYGVGVDVA